MCPFVIDGVDSVLVGSNRLVWRVLMPNTSVHFPDGLLEQLDRLAREQSVSRNRFVVEACRAALAGRRRAWPPGFFDDDDLTADELVELREGSEEMVAAIRAARRNRTEAPF